MAGIVIWKYTRVWAREMRDLEELGFFSMIFNRSWDLSIGDKQKVGSFVNVKQGTGLFFKL